MLRKGRVARAMPVSQQIIALTVLLIKIECHPLQDASSKMHLTQHAITW